MWIHDMWTTHIASTFWCQPCSKKNCGLCDKDFEKPEQLEEHLRQCEIFVCSNSHCRDTFDNLPEIREHILEQHRKNSPEHYSFSYFTCNAKDNSEKEVKKQYTSIYPKDWWITYI